MNFKKFLRTILLDLDVPVYYMTNHNITDDTYIVYSITNEIDSSGSDDDFESAKYTINIRIFSKYDFDELYFNLKNKLKDNNFIFNLSAEDYDSTTGYYAKSAYFEYVDFFM